MSLPGCSVEFTVIADVGLSVEEVSSPVRLKLSICISTLNRAPFIGAALDCIISQATDQCEIVVVDGGSTDNTEEVVSECMRRFSRLRYFRQEKNNGVDRDFDRAVELASGEFCWLFSDDDLFGPGAVAEVLASLRSDVSLVLVNAEHRDFSMSNTYIHNFFGIDSDRQYESSELNRLFEELGRCLMCICCVVIRREIWMARNREPYYGSRFIHIGVIFQQALPGKVLALASPLMWLRIGNEQTHAAEGFKVWLINLPTLVWSLPLPRLLKQEFSAEEPWRRLDYLLDLRGRGGYSILEYQQCVRPRLRSWRDALIPMFVVLFPRRFARWIYALYLRRTRRPGFQRGPWRTMLPESWNRYVDGVTGSE